MRARLLIGALVGAVSCGALALPISSSAHPGGTDSAGGHTCHTNCEDWGYGYGEYHFHGGSGDDGGSGGDYGDDYTEPTVPEYDLYEGEREEADFYVEEFESQLATALASVEAAQDVVEETQSEASELRAVSDTWAARSEGAATAADLAVGEMVETRQAALETVQATEAAYSDALNGWSSERTGLLACAVALLLGAALLAPVRQLAAVVGGHRNAGLTGATYLRIVSGLIALAVAIVVMILLLLGELGPSAAAVVAPVVTAAVLAILARLVWRRSNRADSKGARDRRIYGMTALILALAAAFLVVLAFSSAKPAEAGMPQATTELADLAEPEPTANPTPHVAKLQAKASRIQISATDAASTAMATESQLQTAQANLAQAETMLADVEKQLDFWIGELDYYNSIAP